LKIFICLGFFFPLLNHTCFFNYLYLISLPSTGARMLYNTPEIMLRRKLEEQAELQQAIELQGRRLINLQLPDLRGDYVHRHQRSLSVGAPISLHTHHSPINQTDILTSNGKNEITVEGWLAFETYYVNDGEAFPLLT
jgi:hypothetical protein